jgi:purine-nucleoside phosphorylase
MSEFSSADDLREFAPEWGIVLGSGLGEIVSLVQPQIIKRFGEIGGLPTPRVPGHAGTLTAGTVAGKRVLICQGRSHLYEGYSAREVTASVRLMAECGVKSLVLTNAAGLINPQFQPGRWMMISDHLNITGASPLQGGPHFADMSEVYSRELRECFASAALEAGVIVHTGIYAGVVGPQYETPAEVRMLKCLGADAVGMSTVLEAIQARALSLKVAGFSCLANWGAGISKEPLSHEEVLHAVARAAGDFSLVLRQTLAMPSEKTAQG